MTPLARLCRSLPLLAGRGGGGEPNRGVSKAPGGSGLFTPCYTARVCIRVRAVYRGYNNPGSRCQAGAAAAGGEADVRPPRPVP